MNMQKAAVYLIFLSGFELCIAQISGKKFDNLIDQAVALSEQALYKANFEEALKLTATQNAGSYESAFLELAGDIYFKQGDNEKALVAYSSAKDKSDVPSENLEMKYYNLLEK